jgi:molybdenum cofactor synthesis domain-containing protein
VKVFKRPKVAVISTGSELQPCGSRLRFGKVYDVNMETLRAAIGAAGGNPVSFGVVPDERRKLAAVLKQAIRSCDIVVLSGGTSAGHGDLVPEVVSGLGKPGVLVHGIAQKPGKPTLIAVVSGKPIFGLPGYPVSALMVFEELVAPYLRELRGRTSQPSWVDAKLSEKILSARGRRELVPVKLLRKEGHLLAVPLRKDSGAMVSLSKLDGYFEIQANRVIVDEGEHVRVRLFEV